MNRLPSGIRVLAAVVLSTAVAAPGFAQARQRSQARERQGQSEPVRQAQPRSQAREAQPAPQARAPQARAPQAQAREEGREGSRAGGESRARERADSARIAAIARARSSDDQDRTRAAQNRAVPRAVAPPPTRIERAAPTTNAVNGSTSGATADEEQRRAQPRGTRPRGDNPVVGRAEPRDGRWYGGGRHDGDHDGGYRGGYGYYGGGRYYRNYYRPYYYPYYYPYFAHYYPRHLYPYGYGAFGLGFFYYNPYGWSASVGYGYPYGYYGYPGYYGGGYGGYDSGGQGYYTGELRLRVEPRHAEVYVDGYFAGHVDDFDGTFQALKLEEGEHRVEIRAPGFDTLEFDIRIEVGRKITYRGELRPRL